MHDYEVLPGLSYLLLGEEWQTSVEMKGAYTEDFDTIFLAADEDAAAVYDVSGIGTGLDQYQQNTSFVLSDNFWGTFGKRGGVAVIHSIPENKDWRLTGFEGESEWNWAAASISRIPISEQGRYNWAVWIYGYDRNDWIAARDFGNRIQVPVVLKADFAQHVFLPEGFPRGEQRDLPLHTESDPLTRIEDNYIPIEKEKDGLKLAWFNPSWTYRKSHVIGGSTVGLLTNYAARFDVHYGSGADSGQAVYLNGNCRADFGDVRFTNSADSQLDYWIENKTDNVDAVFWVEIDSIPASPASTSVYIYYGNPAAVYAGNGRTTFDWFDDFSLDTSIDYEIGRHTSVWHGAGVYNPYYDPVNRRVAYDTGNDFTGGWKVRSFNLLIQTTAD